jgi:hypothetical protein
LVETKAALAEGLASYRIVAGAIPLLSIAFPMETENENAAIGSMDSSGFGVP